MASKGARSFAEIARRIELVGKNVSDGAPSGMRVIAEVIMTDAKSTRPGHGVPVDEGTLRNSGRVEGPDGKGAVTAAFGGAAAPYALRQHEDLTLHHELGEARFLTRAVERFKLVGSRAAAALKANAEAGIKAASRGARFRVRGAGGRFTRG